MQLWPSYSSLPLLYNPYFTAIIDIEAIVVPDVADIIEQVGIYIFNNITGVGVVKKHIIVEQTQTSDELMLKYKISKEAIDLAITNYMKITGDKRYIHPKSPTTKCWGVVKRITSSLLLHYPSYVWAKGRDLEQRAFPFLYINELALYGCPAYPKGIPHNPLIECMYFSTYAPIPTYC